jgi:hypothetical protein
VKLGARAAGAAEEKPQRQPPMNPRMTAPKPSRIISPPPLSDGKKPRVGQVPASEKIIMTP